MFFEDVVIAHRVVAVLRDMAPRAAKYLERFQGTGLESEEIYGIASGSSGNPLGLAEEYVRLSKWGFK